MDVRELSPPVANVRLRMNVHNLRHCARGVLGETVVMGVVLLQGLSSHPFGQNKPHPVTARASNSASFVPWLTTSEETTSRICTTTVGGSVTVMR